MNYTSLGFIRIAAVAPPITLGDPAANAATILEVYERQSAGNAAVVLTPELSLTGYSCEDLFHTDELLARSRSALQRVATATGNAALVVGAPWQLVDGRLLNCAFVCAMGRVVGAVPKSAHPNYGEFYEQRWFTSGADVDAVVNDAVGHFRIRRDQLFEVDDTHFALEVCEDLWAPSPPSTNHALAGATIVLNPSASTELVAKAEYRRDLVRMQSARTYGAYVYAGSGPTESTKDVVFGGHLLAAENGVMIGESERFDLGGSALVVDIDYQKCRYERRVDTTFRQAPRGATHVVVETGVASRLPDTSRKYAKHPFVPGDEVEFDARAREILAIQSTGLARRVQSIGSERLVIGLSGGLDSTLAFLVCLDALDRLKTPREAALAVTMPGPGTTDHTLRSARMLTGAAHVSLREIPIGPAVEQHLSDIGHDGTPDVTFENSQARERTQILFDLANKEKGIVVGTGDLSELALGWCTFNADHMANYNVNASVPKTMMAYLVRWYANHRATEPLREVLHRVLATPITPELVPAEDGRITQETEAIIGPYELHDFFLYHYMRTGADVHKIHALATIAFENDYAGKDLKRWLRVFFGRFFNQQFKRTTLPPGPKVGTVSLSPRGDWRMPDEADAKAILAAIDQLT